MRQQLQTAGLLQQMASVFRHAAQSLSAAAAPLTTFGQAASRSSGGGGSSSSSSSTDVVRVVEDFDSTLVLTSRLLSVYIRACRLSTPEGGVLSFEVALPAAAAAIQLHCMLFTTCSSLQQLASQEDVPEAVVLLSHNADVQENCAAVLGEAHWAVVDLLRAVNNYSSMRGSLQSLPGARELLLCPELVPCLAVTVLVTVLGLDTGLQEGTGSGSRSRHAAHGASSSSSSAAGSSRTASSGSSSRSRQALADQSCPQVGSSTPYRQRGNRSSTGSGSSSGRLANGISLDSLSPLSRSLFGLLGVEHGVLLQAASAAKDKWSVNFTPAVFEYLIHPYRFLIEQQVRL
jgi:hypothetical protein